MVIGVAHSYHFYDYLYTFIYKWATKNKNDMLIRKILLQRKFVFFFFSPGAHNACEMNEHIIKCTKTKNVYPRKIYKKENYLK